MELSFDELKEKEVINLSNGKRLGHIVDLIFDLKETKVRGIIVPGEKKLFKKSEDIFISFRQIKTIGDDVVLVDVRDNKYYEKQGNSRTYQVAGASVASRPVMSREKYKKGRSFIRFRRISNSKYI